MALAALRTEEASSPLQIVDVDAQSGTLEILETHSDANEWSATRGEAVLSKPFGEPAEPPDPGFFLGASLPPRPIEK